MPALLFLLAAGNLVVGSSAFVITGLISLIAQDLGASVPAVGLAITAYALSTAAFAPLLVLATGRWPRRRALLLALALLTAGNALCALAQGLAPLYLGRWLLGLGSMFTPVAAGLALAVVAPAQQGRALATVFLGMSLSYVIGVPLGAWVGLQHGWPAALWLMTGASALMGLLAAWAVPARVQAPGVSFAGLGQALRQREVQLVLLTTLLYFSAIFTVFSYIGPVVSALVPGSGPRLSWTLMVFGLSGVAGTVLGGWATDRFGPRRTMQWLLLCLSAAMALLPLSAGHYGAMLAALVLWGCCGFGMMAPQQSRLARLAPAHAPLVLSMNSSMLYIGMALGAALGGPMALWLGFERLGWVAAPLALLAWTVLMLTPPAPPAPPALEMHPTAPS